MEHMDEPGVSSEPNDPLRMRISDADRHEVAEALRRAAGEGRLDFDELDERLESAYAAKIYADLAPILADLPEEAPRLPATTGGAVPAAAPRIGAGVGEVSQFNTSTTIMGGVTRKGVWQVGARHTALALMGGVDIDLREVVFSERETEIVANAVMGGIDIVINARTKVIVDGVGIMGDFSQARDRVPPTLDEGSPVVRVKGIALMGAVTVVRKQMPGEPRPSCRPRRNPPLPPGPQLDHG